MKYRFALHRAARLNDADTIRSLLATKGADVNMLNSDMYAPLHLAILHKNTEAVRILLEHGANPNVSAWCTPPPIHCAIRVNNIALVKTMISFGADIDYEYRGDTAVSAAVTTRNVAMVKYLLQVGADVKMTRAGKICSYKYMTLEMYELFLEYGVTLKYCNTESDMPLYHAISASDVELVKFLIDNEIGTAADERILSRYMYLAVKAGNIDIFKLLLEQNPTVLYVHHTGRSLLHCVSIYNRPEMAEMLLSLGANANSRDSKVGDTPLHHAVYSDNIEMVKVLIRHGADVNVKNNFKNTPLFEALESNKRCEVIYALLEGGADLGETNGEGYILHKAIHRIKSLNLVEKLICLGADVNVMNEMGRSPIHEAVTSDSECFTEILLKNGADPNASDNAMVSPLHLSVMYNHLMNTCLLLDSGADVNAVDKFRRTPLMYTGYKNNAVTRCIIAYILAREHTDPSVRGTVGYARNIRFIENSAALNEMKKECYHEINEMRKISLGGGRSLDIFLSDGNIDLLAKLVCNPNVLENYRKFDVFKVIIRKKVRLARDRCRIITAAASKIDNVVANDAKNRWKLLPPEIHRIILSKLSNEELRAIA